EPRAERCGDPRGAVGEHLPLHRLREDPRGGARGREGRAGMSITVGIASDGERADVEAFYRRELKREVPLDADHEVFVARQGAAIVAALRLCPEAGTLLL